MKQMLRVEGMEIKGIEFIPLFLEKAADDSFFIEPAIFLKILVFFFFKIESTVIVCCLDISVLLKKAPLKNKDFPV